MADINSKGISLKALVDKGNNRIVFAESDVNFVDVLFSLLTMPLGTVIRLTRNHPPTGEIGCMNNLYSSIENLDVQSLFTEACKTMLLHPQNEAETHCRSLKLRIDDSEPIRYFMCSSGHYDKCRSVSNYNTAPCGVCGKLMSHTKNMKKVESARDRGVFAKGVTRFIVSDELRITPPSTERCFALLSNLGVKDGSTIEERTFNVGVNEVLNLLKCSLVSTTALTQILLKHKPVPQLDDKNVTLGIFVQSQSEGEASNSDGKMCVKLVLSKSKKIVCYAEAGEDFVDLLFSFLTLPLGYIVKNMHGNSFKGCINHLYNSVLDLDAEKSFKSDELKEMLVSPKLAPCFGYVNQLLDIEEASNQLYYMHSSKILTKDKTHIPSGCHHYILTFTDPKSNEANSDGGFVKGPALFTITDSLIITPISPISGISLLNRLKIPFSDIEERVVHVGKEEALRLLAALFVSESALTNAFIPREPKQE
ncbi:hypothetical protein F0562_022031 [Nyssa sinensis]|uniref:DUF674 domain-containing protein n=1 Tax=Nyssa sinensis TaxID=561372 RepID=A0A5J5BPY5_9ASTE|nr:hypothetical protein F0562_022031 [Nyssa sinensis]